MTSQRESQTGRWSFEKNANETNLFPKNKRALLIESGNALIECDLEEIISKTQKLL